MYLAETETNEIKKIVQIRVYLTGKDQAAAQPWQQFLYHRLPNSEVVTDRREFKVKGEMTNELVTLTRA